MTYDAPQPPGDLEACVYYFTKTGETAWEKHTQTDNETLREVLSTLAHVSSVASTTAHLALVQRDSLRRIEEKVLALEADRASFSDVLRAMSHRLARLEGEEGG